jgi:quercetin dioxygenase-like cupin family protein
MTTLVLAVHNFVFHGVGTAIFHANTGEGLPRHEHNFKHAVACFAGRIVIRKEHITVEMTKTSKPVVLKENEWHEIEALEDETVFGNIYAQENLL